jgi:hypothetical protein
MNVVGQALEKLKRIVEEHPEVASAALLAFAVERRVIDAPKAVRLADQVDLADFGRVKALLVLEVERSGRRAELVGLLRAGRRIQRDAETLVRRTGRF